MTTAFDDRPVVFLDKDGTLIEDLPYNVDPARVRLAPGAREAVVLWGEHGWRIAVITNQSGVARGYFTLDDLDALSDHLEREVRALGAGWAGFHACPHHPDGINEYAIDCDCRKPEPGLIRRAAEALDVDPAGTWFIGDTWMDVVAGRAAGCRTILVGREWRLVEGWTTDRKPDHAVPDLLAAARICIADRAGADRSAPDRGMALSAGAGEVIR
jgi:D-glycero-D-manno-heptose 1,7-bisphosphate phosphatase